MCLRCGRLFRVEEAVPWLMRAAFCGLHYNGTLRMQYTGPDGIALWYQLHYCFLLGYRLLPSPVIWPSFSYFYLLFWPINRIASSFCAINFSLLLKMPDS